MITAPPGRSSEKRNTEVIQVSEPITSGPTIERYIGGTTYVVTSTYSPKATETAAEKMRRIIMKEHEKVLRNSK